MEVHLTPEVETELADLASRTGQSTDELAQHAIRGYLDDLAGVRDMLDSRYDDLKSGRVQGIDGEAFFEELRLRQEARLKARNL